MFDMQNVDYIDLYGDNLLDDDAVYFLTSSNHPEIPIRSDKFARTYPLINVGYSGSLDNLFAYIFNMTGKHVNVHDSYSIANGLHQISSNWKIISSDDVNGLVTIKTSQQENRGDNVTNIAYLLSDFCRQNCNEWL